ncbi:MAG TPA: acyltransferase [Chitinophagaceae bacterium]|nr:acyltransferase [Chitinophagaceae bacterium]
MFKDLFNARYILASNRLGWIDYARGICIILVCYRHCFDGLKEAHLAVADYPLLQIFNVCFYSFRMPLFFIVSGLFISRSLQKKKLSDYIWGRFSIVFYPLIIWGSLQITLQLILKNYVNGAPVPFDYINLIIFPRNPTNNQQFWYLNALFFVGAFYGFFKVVLRFKLWHQVVLGLLLYSAAGYMGYNGLSFYIFPDIFHFYIYFCIGDIISAFIFKKETTDILLSNKWLVSSAIFCIIMQTIFTVVNMRHGDDNYINVNMTWLYFPISLSGCLFMIQIAQTLQKTGIIKWLRVIGYHSLYIYLMHLMLIAAVRIVLVKIFHIHYIPLIMFIAISLGVIIPILVYNLCIRLGMWWLFSLKKPEAEIQHYTTTIRTV